MARKINDKNRTGSITRRPVGLDQGRRTHSDPETFLNGAEKHAIDTAEETRKLTTKARTKLRARGKNSNLYALRGTAQQQQLIQHAAEEEDVSIQKLLASLIFPVLEEKYGRDLPLDNL